VLLDQKNTKALGNYSFFYKSEPVMYLGMNALKISHLGRFVKGPGGEGFPADPIALGTL